MALTSSYEALLILAVIAGLGNAVFHPADYSILMSTVNERRIGRAFSIHTASGTAGSAIAPVVILSIAAVWDWRMAVLSVAVLGAVTGIAMIVVNSLALAFSLAGVVAAVRFRFSLNQPSDAMYIFVAIGIGLGSGIGALGISGIISLMFVLATLVIWKLEYGKTLSGPFLTMLTRRDAGEDDY